MKLFLSEQPFSLNDEIVPLMKEFFLKPFREKKKNYYQFAHEVDYNDMFKFATEILIIRSFARNFKKNHQALI
jgi:hypothetical protein